MTVLINSLTFFIHFHFSLFNPLSLSRFIRDNLLTMATLCGAIAGVALGLSLKSMGDGIYTPRQARYILLRSHKIMKIHVFISATWATLASCSWTCWSVSSFLWLFQALSPPLGLLTSKCLERWLKSMLSCEWIFTTIFYSKMKDTVYIRLWNVSFVQLSHKLTSNEKWK